VYTLFVLYSFSYTFPQYLFPPTSLGRTCSALLFYDFVEEKTEKVKRET
jgi:hypothetical protein